MLNETLEAEREYRKTLTEEYDRGYKKGFADTKTEQKWIPVTERIAIEWFENRIAVMPESETKEMFCMAISALEKQEVDKCCETCKYKSRSSQEIPCCDCYMSSCFEDYYESYMEEEL